MAQSMISGDDAAPRIRAGRLPARQLAENFADLHPPLDAHEAAVAADRCYFCHDAPCVTACPTTIDIPLFIRQIATGQPAGAAKTIFNQNILGGMCARVCPTETLCEEACVRETAEGKPVEIGRLQRFATDAMMQAGVHPYERATPTGKRVAVVGAGPAGLACAHRLAMKGHDVVIYDARANPGGLNEYGIAAYKTVDGFAQAEVDWLMKIGGITLETGRKLGGDLSLVGLRAEFDAVFLGLGLGGVNDAKIEGAGVAGVRDAVDFIAELRQAKTPGDVAVGTNVVVIGGGMTAVDAAVQSKLLGAQSVVLAYRRRREDMNASAYEQDLAALKGVRIETDATPLRILSQNGAATGVVFECTGGHAEGERSGGGMITTQADMVLMAVGQRLQDAFAPLKLDGRKIAVDEFGRTSEPCVWAGGDCAAGGDDLTVTAVAEGRDAAEDIHRALS